jgi:hypothetical protein
MLWALFVAGISVLEAKEDDEWLLRAVREKCKTLGLHSWEHLRVMLDSFLWIGALHDHAGRRLCEAVTGPQ